MLTELEAVDLRRLDLTLLGQAQLLAIGARELGQRGAINVRVAQAGPEPATQQTHRGEQGDRALADATLARADGNHVLHARQWLRRVGDATRRGMISRTHAWQLRSSARRAPAPWFKRRGARI
jgi:hypothetical protein